MSIESLNKSIDENLYGWVQIFMNETHTEEAIFILNATVDFRKTLLHIVCSMGYEKTATLLVKLGVNINTLDYFGATALHYACFGEHTEIAKMLVQNGAKVYKNADVYMQKVALEISVKGRETFEIMQEKIKNDSFASTERYQISQLYTAYKNEYSILAGRLLKQAVVGEDLATPYFCNIRTPIGLCNNESHIMNEEERRLFTLLEIL